MDLALLDIAKEYEHPGMIDWLTLRLDLALLPEPVVRHLQSLNSMIFKVNAQTGDIDWQAYAWESVRSDTHQVCFKVGCELHIQGSPARIGLPNNAFGSLDIQYCANKMIRFAESYLSGLPGCRTEQGVTRSGGPCVVQLPGLEHWICSRIDVTRNYLMQSEAEARQALEYLKQAPEGKQKHSFESNGFYVGKRSNLHRGKIYLKGQDAKRCKRAGRAEYTDLQLIKSQRILRSEYTIARGKIKRLLKDQNLNWHQMTPAILLKLHDSYFRDYFSDIEVTDMSTVYERLLAVAPTEGQARAAYDCYTRIRMTGYEQAKITFTKTTWYRNIQHLKAAGFKRADLNMINVVPLQKRAIKVSEPLRHWDDIRIA